MLRAWSHLTEEHTTAWILFVFIQSLEKRKGKTIASQITTESNKQTPGACKPERSHDELQLSIILSEVQFRT